MPEQGGNVIKSLTVDQPMIVLVGVGHVFDIKDQVRALVLSRGPDAVLVELDAMRYRALRAGPEATGGPKGPLTYRLLAFFQRRMAGEMGGGRAGEEMLAAIDAASEVGAEVALIDQDANETFRRLMSEMPLKERVGLFLNSFTGLFASRSRVERELERYAEDEESMIGPMWDAFPTLVRILIDERNQHMAARIAHEADRHERVMAFVGDGHIRGIVSLLDRQVEVVRLMDLMGDEEDGSEATYSFTHRVA